MGITMLTSINGGGGGKHHLNQDLDRLSAERRLV